ncbi:two-component response regulator-like PRR1 isoform X2 [Cicer arietinum]|uniref:Zinc finger protein CONSTANS-like isoform X2 n=1 Tax=Cicer arietinum TaxID=3827 RepID=A0A1S2YK53_CICAR|nr:zinc finger protein CONSTANS-like isoform X2 [Cicer arietinum]
MYTNFHTTFSRATDTSPLHCPTTPLQPQLITFNESDSLLDSLSQLNSETSYNNAAAVGGSYNSCSSGCTSYMGSPSSLASYETQRVSNGLIQRSISSHSLQKSDGPHYHPFMFAELLDQDNGPVRRVYSAGDLQRVNGMQQHYHQSDSPLSIESSMIIEEINRAASPYSPQEKRMRIERYRSKRNQRNYTKKIKYVCRKTLADSRPRIRGRFARNDEIVMNPPNQWSNIISNGDELEDEEDENWANLFDSLAPTSNLAQEPQHSSSFDVFY